MTLPTIDRPPSTSPADTAGGLLLSAIHIHVEQEHFEASVLSYSDESYAELRNREDVFPFRRKKEPPASQVLVFALGDDVPNDLPSPITLECKKEHGAVAAVIERRLPSLFPELKLRRTFAGLERVRPDDLVAVGLARARIARPIALEPFHKRLRVRLKVRREFMPGRGPFLALAVEFKREFSIDGVAKDLLDRGLSLAGLGVVSCAARDEWLGQIVKVAGRELIVAGEDGDVALDPADCCVEPTTAAFATLFRQALGADGFDRYEVAEVEAYAEQFSGDGYLKRLTDVSKYFAARGSLRVARGITISFKDLTSASFGGDDPDAVRLSSVKYRFSADGNAIDVLPYRGLDRYGPADGRTFRTKEPELLIVCPKDARRDGERFVERLLHGLSNERTTRFARGLVGTYRLRGVTPRFVYVDLSRAGSGEIGGLYVKAIEETFDPSRRPDVALIINRDDDAFLPEGNPYRASKAYLLSLGIPSQEMRLSKIRSSAQNLQYILEDVAVAIYAKIGGCPWTLRSDPQVAKEIVLGMAYAEVGGRFESRRRYMGITTVFTSDGTYVLAARSPRCRYEDYPEALASTVRATVKRLIDDYGWGRGDLVRLIVHSSKPLRKDDISTVAREATQQLGGKVRLETAFLTVAREHPFKVLDPAARGRQSVVELISGGYGRALVGQCVPDRGVIVNLGRSSRLVCVHGSSLIAWEGAGIPHPLMVKLDPASSYRDMHTLARQVYQFTGLSWGSMKPVAEPVTIHYARLIAQMISKLDGHPRWSENLIDTQLRKSRWFL